MRQRQLARYIAHRINAGNVGRHLVVNHNVAALGSDANALQPQIFGVGLHADGGQRLVKPGGFSGAVLGDGKRNPGPVHLRGGHAGARTQFNPLAPESPLQLPADFLIFARHNARQQFNDGHFGAVHPVNVGKFHPDCAAPHNRDGTRRLILHNRLPTGNDALAVNGQRRNAARPRPRSDDNVAGAYRCRPPLGIGHRNRIGGNEARRPGNMRHAVLAEQKPHAPRHPVHHLPAPPHRHAIIGPEIVKPQPKLVGAMNIRQYFGVLEQSLGRNAAPIQANAAQSLPFNNASPQAQLPGPYGRNIPPRPTANYCYIILGVGCHRCCPVSKYCRAAPPGRHRPPPVSALTAAL